jgi:ankyrin repeat protein
MEPTADLKQALENSDWDAVKRLVANTPDLAKCRDTSGASLTMMLAYRGAGDAAAFVAGHIEPDVFEATAIGDAAALTRILSREAGAADRFSADGWTPLHLAGFFGQVECAAILLQHGAKHSAFSTNAMHNQPLHAALSGRQSVDLAKLLLDNGADVNAKAATSITPLHLAASRGNQVLIDLLLAKGADKSAKMENGMRPADLARERGFPAAAQSLV